MRDLCYNQEGSRKKDARMPKKISVEYISVRPQLGSLLRRITTSSGEPTPVSKTRTQSFMVWASDWVDGAAPIVRRGVPIPGDTRWQTIELRIYGKIVVVYYDPAYLDMDDIEDAIAKFIRIPRFLPTRRPRSRPTI